MGSTAVQVHTGTPPASRLSRSSAVENFGQMLDLARELVPTGFLPEHIKTPGQACAIILQGHELGMQPMRALRSLTMVKGKVVENADSQLARFKDEGGRAVWVKLDETVAVLQLRHPNGDEHTETFTMKDADAAGLTKPSSRGEPSMFTKYPKAMLRSRAITAGLKSLGWSGAVGAYDPNEATEFAPASAAAAIASVSSEGRADTAAAVREEATAVPMATEQQLARILSLNDHTVFTDAQREWVTRKLKGGLTAEKAEEITAILEREIKKVTPAPLPPKATAAPEPTVADLNAAADQAAGAELAARYTALLRSDRIAPNVEDRVRQRIGALPSDQITLDVLRAAIAELEDAEIPF